MEATIGHHRHAPQEEKEEEKVEEEVYRSGLFLPCGGEGGQSVSHPVSPSINLGDWQVLMDRENQPLVPGRRSGVVDGSVLLTGG